MTWGPVYSIDGFQKVNNADPSFIVYQEGVTKRANTKKAAIMTIGIVLLLAIFAAVSLAGVYAFTEYFHKIVTFSFMTSEATKQETIFNLNSNIIQDFVDKEQFHAHYVDDFNTLMSVVKFSTESRKICYISPIIPNRNTDLTKITKPSGDMIEIMEDNVYEVSSAPISDLSFLNRKSRTMCKGIETFWVESVQTEEETDEEDAKEKRNICFFCPQRCYVNWSEEWECSNDCYNYPC